MLSLSPSENRDICISRRPKLFAWARKRLWFEAITFCCCKRDIVAFPSVDLNFNNIIYTVTFTRLDRFLLSTLPTMVLYNQQQQRFGIWKWFLFTVICLSSEPVILNLESWINVSMSIQFAWLLFWSKVGHTCEMLFY